LQEAIELAAPPLTHHEILSLVEPFARRGRHVDLAASVRQERRLVFKPPAGAPTPAPDAPREVLRLDCLEGGTYRLTRTLGHPLGATATLVAQGNDLAALLADVEAVPAAHHFVAGRGFLVARSYTVERARSDGPASLDLVHGSVHVDGLVLALRVSAVRRVAGDLSLEPTSAAKPVLPEDLLAVLGWNWARLVPVRQGWTSKLRLRGSAAERTARAETALDQAAAHLARTLAEPPARYHERMRRARWGVFFRRGIPTFTAVTLVGIAALLPKFLPDLPMPVWVAMYHVPTIIVAISFMMQELPRFEIPPWPKPLQTPQWRAGSPAAMVAGAAAGG
jgi:hypothetical protein